MKKRIFLLFVILVLLLPFVSAAGVERAGIQDNKLVITIQGRVNSQIEFFKEGLSRGTYKLCTESICDFKTKKEFKINLSTTGINEIGDYVLRIEEIVDNEAAVQSYPLTVNRENLDACSDSTLEGACSSTRPLFCEKRQLVERCGRGTFSYYTSNLDLGTAVLHTRESCGECPTGKICQANGSCVEETKQTASKQTVDGGVKLAGAEELICIKGNLDNDGKVDIFDLLEMLKVLGGAINPKADVNSDGKVDIFDLLALLNLIGKEEKCEEVEPITIGFNNKNMDLYSDKEVFLISDKNWQDVLQLVPLTTWTINADESCPQQMNELPYDYINLPDKKVCAYPTLVYHEEENNNLYVAPYSDYSSENRINVFVTIPAEEGGWRADAKLSKNYNLQPGEIITYSYSVTTDDFVNSIEISQLPDFLEFYEPLNGIIDGINRSLPELETFEFKFKVKENINVDWQDSFDADSTIHFMQQYDTKKVTVIGNTPQELDNLLITEPELGAGLRQGNIKRISAGNYVDYWSYYATVVYVENDYELALMASTYASLINAPLIIEETDLALVNFDDKNVICIGNPQGQDCDIRYSSIFDIQQKYIQETNTDKIILVNPNDMQIQANRLKNQVYELFSKTSLAAPILASAKHQLLLPLELDESSDELFGCELIEKTAQNADLIDNFIETSISNLQISPNYLTILAQPKALPDSICRDQESAERTSKDNEYADIGNQLNVGRIYGLSLSDVSAYLSRSIFYKMLFDKTYEDLFTGLSISHDFEGSRFKASYIKERTEKSGYDSECFYDNSVLSPRAFHEDKIAFISNLDGLPNLYVYDIMEEKLTQITEEGTNLFQEGFFGEIGEDVYYNPISMHGNIVVWGNSRHVLNAERNPVDIYMYDLSSDTKKLLVSGLEPLDIIGLDIFDNIIVYGYDREPSGVFIIKIGDSTPTKIADGIFPKIFGKNVAFIKDNELYVYNLERMEETQITNLGIDIFGFSIYKNNIYWNELNEDEMMIYSYDLDSQEIDNIIMPAWGFYLLDVYEDYAVGWGLDDGYIHLLNLNDHSDTIIGELMESYPIIYNNRVFYTLVNNSGFLKYYDISKGSYEQIYIGSICNIPEKPNTNDFKNKQFITYNGHGSYREWSNVIDSEEIPNLDLTYSFGAACSTNNFWRGIDKTFGANMLRKGAVGYHGATGVSYNDVLGCEVRALQELTTKDISLGELTTTLYTLCDIGGYHNSFITDFILLGDPTLKPIFKEVEW